MIPELPRDDWFAALADARRRALYEYVVGQGDRGVGRDEAADATGLKRAHAAFHLDQLVKAGLLRTDFRRLTGRAGPGAGRPAKLYRPAVGELSLTVPERRYLLAARMLLEALAGDPNALERTSKVAHHQGLMLGLAATHGQPGEQVLTSELRSLGYRPRSTPAGSITLDNCPFRDLAEQNRELTCRTNLAFLAGLARGVGTTQLVPRLAPHPGSCCVLFESQ